MENTGQGKIRVGVIMGGMSSEREVSLESGRNIFAKIPRHKFEAVPIFMDGMGALWEIPVKLLMRNCTKDIEEDLAGEAERLPYESLKSRIDLACLGLHGKYGEDGCIQGLLELLNIPYTGSGVLSSALGMDKLACRRILAGDNINVPRTVFVYRKQWESETHEAIIENVSSQIGFPCVVKPAREGCSTAVKKVIAKEGLSDALTAAFLWDDKALVEEFINGTEVTCGVIGNDAPMAFIPSETVPTDDILSLEDKFLYGQGENKTPARLPNKLLDKIKETALRAFLSLDLKGYARIDMFVTNSGEVIVLEANTLPGMTPSTVLFHQAAAAGFTQADLIEQILNYALEAHSHKKGPL